MKGQWMAAAAALALLSACSSFEPAGRNARDGAAPPPPPSSSAPAPQQAAQQPSAPGVAAPNVSVAPPVTQAQPQPSQQRAGGGDIVVPGQVERQVQAPDGDPRSTAERMADIRAWDRCVMRIQGAGGDDPTRPQLDTPEEVCRGELGMASRTAVPASRR